MDLEHLFIELEAKGLDNDRAQTDKTLKYLNITRDTGEFLRVMVRAARAGNILEVGTSNGYSTLWLASSLPADGRVTTLEHSDKKAEEASSNFRRAGLSEKIDLLKGDARILLRGLEPPYDLIFLDADRSVYMEMMPDILRLLKSGGLLICDNAVSHASELEAFISHLTSRQEFSTALVPVGKGEFLAYKS